MRLSDILFEGAAHLLVGCGQHVVGVPQPLQIAVEASQRGTGLFRLGTQLGDLAVLLLADRPHPLFKLGICDAFILERGLKRGQLLAGGTSGAADTSPSPAAPRPSTPLAIRSSAEAIRRSSSAMSFIRSALCPSASLPRHAESWPKRGLQGS